MLQFIPIYFSSIVKQEIYLLI